MQVRMPFKILNDRDIKAKRDHFIPYSLLDTVRGLDRAVHKVADVELRNSGARDLEPSKRHRETENHEYVDVLIRLRGLPLDHSQHH